MFHLNHTEQAAVGAIISNHSNYSVYPMISLGIMLFLCSILQILPVYMSDRPMGQERPPTILHTEAQT